MKYALIFTFGPITIFGICCLAHLIYKLDSDPEWLYSIFIEAFNIETKHKIYLYTCICTMIVTTFLGTKGLLFWIPKNWGGFDEYGDFHPIVNSISAYLAFFSIKFIDIVKNYIIMKVQTLNQN